MHNFLKTYLLFGKPGKYCKIPTIKGNPPNLPKRSTGKILNLVKKT